MDGDGVSTSSAGPAGAPARVETVRLLAGAALHNLEVHRSRIDDLNVYPVPDGDTGTNLVHTVRGIVEAIEESNAPDCQALAEEISRAALGKSKGNSGVIFSQIVRGFADVLGKAEAYDVPTVARGFRAASDAAYRAVSRVGAVEGTMLTVIREMAEEAESEQHRDLRLPELLRVVLARGEDALSRTPEMLETLRKAGVVDAGGAGLVEILRGVTLVANGEPLPDAVDDEEELGFDAIHQELSTYRYCTGFLVAGERLDASRLEDDLARLGDSLLVVGDDSLLKVHVHTDDPGAALAVATAVGVIDDVEIANMHAQTEAREKRLLGIDWATLPAFATGVVAVSQGEGVRELFEGENATVIDGGQTTNPSVDEIVRAIEATPAEAVIVLPNNSNVLLAAEQAARLVHSKRVHIVPSRSVQAGWAALGRYVSTSSPEENEASMLDVLASVATGEVTVASRDAQLDGVAIKQGDYLGLVDESAVASGEDLDRVVLDVVARVLAGDRGWLGILTGEDAPALDGVLAEVRSAHPELEIAVHEGGQPHYPLLLVAE
ncbi:MAG: DAK2 domain-containing protein [Gaiellaceae bacterium]